MLFSLITFFLGKMQVLVLEIAVIKIKFIMRSMHCRVIGHQKRSARLSTKRLSLYPNRFCKYSNINKANQ